MKVTVKFNSDLKDRYAPTSTDGVVDLILNEGSKVRDVFDRLQVEDGEVGFVLRNGNKVQMDDAVSDQDFIHIFSLVAGG